MLKIICSKVYILAVFVVLISIVNNSCKKNSSLSTGGVVKFSVDTLKFDTVFSTQGSYTNGLVIYNPQNEAITVSSIRLQNGTASFFHLNVDGFNGNNIQNLKIAAHDSIYVFATVNINPNDSLTPFVITDRLIATLNGNDFGIPITAYGQNAHFIVSDSIYQNTTWLTDKPYVVIHSLVVGPNATLNVPANCRIYMHQDARIFVFGRLDIDTMTGTDSVVIQGDRLDRAYFGYEGYPGEWGGIYFITGSWGNINHAVIKNCGGSTKYHYFQTQSAAIEVDTGAQLTMTNTIVENSIGYGILNFHGIVNATNCLIKSTGAEAFVMLQGGYANMTNCTFANYGGTGLVHSDYKTVTIVNYLNLGNGNWLPGALNATLKNCIVYGSLDSELICDSLAGATAYLDLNHCLVKTGNFMESFVQFDTCLRKNDPLFKNPLNGDFHLKTGSPAIGAGSIVNAPMKDLDGWLRGSGNDIGCFQYH